jgi:hypothetical protein
MGDESKTQKFLPKAGNRGEEKAIAVFPPSKTVTRY